MRALRNKATSARRQSHSLSSCTPGQHPTDTCTGRYHAAAVRRSSISFLHFVYYSIPITDTPKIASTVLYIQKLRPPVRRKGHDFPYNRSFPLGDRLSGTAAASCAFAFLESMWHYHSVTWGNFDWQTGKRILGVKSTSLSTRCCKYQITVIYPSLQTYSLIIAHRSDISQWDDN